MTPQETIETIKIAIAEVEWNYPLDYAVAFEEAIKALEKQIPKKPKYVGEVPVCSCGMNLSKEEFSYCRYCGQAIDWSDNNGRMDRR